MRSYEFSPKRKKSNTKKRKAQEDRWASRSSEVITYKVGDEKPRLPKPGALK